MIFNKHIKNGNINLCGSNGSSYFAERESDWGNRLSYSYRFTVCHALFINTKFKWCVILQIKGHLMYFKYVLITSVT